MNTPRKFRHTPPDELQAEPGRVLLVLRPRDGDCAVAIAETIGERHARGQLTDGAANVQFQAMLNAGAGLVFMGYFVGRGVRGLYADRAGAILGELRPGDSIVSAPADFAGGL